MLQGWRLEQRCKFPARISETDLQRIVTRIARPRRCSLKGAVDRQ